MNKLGREAEIEVYNENILQELAKIINIFQGKFCLIFACCNNYVLQEVLGHKLVNISPIPIQKIVLDKSVKGLKSGIEKKLGDEHPRALMVFGLQSVTNIDEVLRITNQTRDKFDKDYSFPLVLWVNNKILKKLMRLAPDFSNWVSFSKEFKSDIDKN